MRTEHYSFRVLVNDRPITEYEHNGNVYVEGRKDSEFQLELTNHTGARILAVPSVDGLDTLEGKPAGLDSKGYIVTCYSTVRVPGWTLDNKGVAKFIFKDKEKSYAEFAGPDGAKNTGVVGFLIFEETVKKHTACQHGWYPHPTHYGATLTGMPSLKNYEPDSYFRGTGTTMNLNQYSSTASASSSVGSAASVAGIASNAVSDSFSLGTGFGAKQEFVTTVGSFERGKLIGQPVIYYDSRKNLQKRGIIIKKQPELPGLPQAFPGIGCKVPPGYKG